MRNGVYCVNFPKGFTALLSDELQRAFIFMRRNLVAAAAAGKDMGQLEEEVAVEEVQV